MTNEIEELEAMKAIEAAIPMLPPHDAACHVGLVDQSDCAYCQRIINANKAVSTLLQSLKDKDAEIERLREFEKICRDLASIRTNATTGAGDFDDDYKRTNQIFDDFDKRFGVPE